MIKGINKLLRLVGLNLVRAKRKKVARRILVIDGSIPVGDECVNEFNAENAGRTHYVGDDCPGGHRVGTENICIGPEAKVHVVDPDAAFVPVDIGVNDHKMTDTEHESKR